MAPSALNLRASLSSLRQALENAAGKSLWELHETCCRFSITNRWSISAIGIFHLLRAAFSGAIECYCHSGRQLLQYAELARPTPLRALVHLSGVFLGTVATRFSHHQLYRWLVDTRKAIPVKQSFRRPAVGRAKRSDALDRRVSQLPHTGLQPRGTLSCDHAAIPL